jgi:hypothetical protein
VDLGTVVVVVDLGTVVEVVVFDLARVVVEEVVVFFFGTGGMYVLAAQSTGRKKS